MEQIEQIAKHLEEVEVGNYIKNDDNGRSVEVVNMAGGKYLCYDGDGEVMMLTNSARKAALCLLKVKCKVRRIIDYTLSRRGHRVYVGVDMAGNVIDLAGSWKSLSACRRHMEKMGMIYEGYETVNQNYKHWADFEPVAEGVMADG